MGISMTAIPSDVLWHPDDWNEGVLRTLRSRMIDLESAVREDPAIETSFWITIGHELAHKELLPELIELIAQSAIENGRGEDGATLMWLASRVASHGTQGPLPERTSWAEPLFDPVRSGRWQAMTRNEKREVFHKIGLVGD